MARGEEGMIAVPESDPGLFLRYWNLPEETAKYRHDGYFFTGDYAKVDENGRNLPETTGDRKGN